MVIYLGRRPPSHGTPSRRKWHPLTHSSHGRPAENSYPDLLWLRELGIWAPCSSIHLSQRIILLLSFAYKDVYSIHVPISFLMNPKSIKRSVYDRDPSQFRYPPCRVQTPF